MKNTVNISVLIPDGESRLLMSVVNCLSQMKNISIYVMSNDKSISMKYSKSIYKIFYYEKTNSEIEWVDNINKVIKDHNIDLIMPIYEIGIRSLIKYKKYINDQTKLMLLPTLSNFDKAINKGKLVEVLMASSIPHPESVLVNIKNKYYVKLPKFPIIVKPINTAGNGDGINVFHTKETLKVFLDSCKSNHDYLIQNYIKGYDIDCSVLCKKGEVLVFTIQKGIMYGKTKFSPQLGQEFLHNEKLLKTVKKLVKTLNWSGVAHIDMRYDEVMDDFKVIEINPRFWQSLLASLFAKINFPYLYCLVSLNLSLPILKTNFIKFYSCKGLIKKIKKDVSYIFRFYFIYKNTPLKLVLADPIPVMHLFYSYVLRVYNKYTNSLLKQIHPWNIWHPLFGNSS